jgi:hypothetical protein
MYLRPCDPDTLPLCSGEISNAEWGFFVRGSIGLPPPPEGSPSPPTSPCFTQAQWNALLSAEQVRGWLCVAKQQTVVCLHTCLPNLSLWF